MKKFVIYNATTDLYIGVDQASGGYPYDTKVERAEVFYATTTIKSYIDIIKPKDEWEIHELTITTKEI